MARSNYHYAGYDRSGPRYWAKKLGIYALVIAGALWLVAPFWWTITGALSENPGAGLVVFFPAEPTLENFETLVNEVPIGRWFLNAFILAGTVTLFNVTFDTLAGYAFAKLEFFARDKIFLAFIGTMMIPGMVTLIPVYILLSELGWINTYRGLIVPFIASPFGIFLLRQHFLSLPTSLGEAARLDGCNKLQVFYHIYLPLAKPAVATLGIFTFMFSWNDFEWPLIIATSESMYTLPVALFAVQGRYTQDWGLVMATAAVMVLPIIVVFLLAQRHFIRGMTLSGMKG
ncbi:carbohydrate ABC transporter permease [Halobacteria archaeon AArc-m2/3/4]|uniref:Carbohydrate ABC transporter permease n=1 Tax=Natronoglomus mannanivorans TaxID=2979990 RepID=A0ABT2QJF1_9EURY|nr:carbohydrate ABC transporter permease [Halobacteria archaeon AArc-m2/3/4]